MRDRAACPRTSLNARNLESRVGGPRQRISSTPRARIVRPSGTASRASGSRSGSREEEVISAWKRGSHSLFRREDGAPTFGSRAPWQGSFRVSSPVTRRPDLTTKPSKSGRPLETSFARRALCPIMNGGGGPAGPSRFHREQSTRTRTAREPKGSKVERVRRFGEVQWVPTSICRLLIEWRSILLELAVHPACDGQ
jgi:hypothetical protein